VQGKAFKEKNENEIFIKKKIFKTCYIGVGVDKDKE
jgi:hypothetical protein